MMLKGKPSELATLLFQLDQEKEYEIKEYKSQRNKDQNAKYWKLLNELSRVIKIGVEELHFNMLKNYSPRYEILVPQNYELRGIEYYERLSTIKKGDNLFNVYRVYTPSHELKTDEFAILLDGLCEECKQVGIETYSPDELKEMEAMCNGIMY